MAQLLRSALCPRRYANLPLPLLVLGVLANHHHLAFAADDFAFIANLFDRRTNFHIRPSTEFNRQNDLIFLSCLCFKSFYLIVFSSFFTCSGT
jgi:hypothetical protein